MSVNLAPGPFGAGGQFFDTNGKPLNAGFINTYAAGTTTPLATFTTSVGNVANSTTITLGVDGRPPNEIWLTAGSSYRFDLLDSSLNLIKTYDNLSGINDISGIGEWVLISLTPVFISSTSFSLTGNQTTLLPNGMRLKTVNTGGTMYGKVVSSSYSSIPNTTTIVIANDVGSALDSGLSSISYSILSPVNPSLDSDYVLRKATLVTSAGVTNIWAIAGDYAHVTGGSVTTITSFGTAFYAGNERTVIADAAFTISHGAPIQCLGSANIAALPGDRFVVRADTTTVANITQYSRLSSAPLVYATQAEQEAATSLVASVTPGRQQFHPSAAKGWCQANVTGAAISSYNVSSVTDQGAGDAIVNWTTSFSSGAYCPIASVITDNVLIPRCDNTNFAAGTTRINTPNTSSVNTDPNFFTVVAFGDQ